MDYSKYSPDWKDIIRPSILKRDNYKCKVCGIVHKTRVYKNKAGKYVECDEFIEVWAKSNGFKVFTLYLQVAHLDHNKSNNDPSNLITLCPVHHAKNDAQHKAFSRKVYKKKIDVNPVYVSKYFLLFEHMKNEHNLILTDSQLIDIVNIVDSLKTQESN